MRIGSILTAAVLAALSSAAPANAQQDRQAATVTLPPVPFGLSPMRTGPDQDRRTAWWRRARVGMFIHFGVYAIPARGEWVMFNESIPHRDYAKFADQFTPDPKAPTQWTELAKTAGMKYVVLTARHHDGYSLFDSRGNPFNSVKTAAHQDIVRTFTDSARQNGLKVGLYYSPLDWRFPGYFMPDLYAESAEKMGEQYRSEMDQLATGYGKIDLLWYDGGGEDWLGFGGIEFRDGWHSRDKSKHYSGKFSWHDDEVNGRLAQAQPGILINDRTSSPSDWRTREGWKNLGDFNNLEPWELGVPLAGSWGYTAGAKPASLIELVQLTSKTATRDGNLLINVGPAPDGSIPADQVVRMKELGAWLAKNGEAIYNTRGGPFLPTATMGTTRLGKSVYLQLLADKDGQFPSKVDLPLLDGGNRAVKAEILGGTRQRVVLHTQGDRQVVNIPNVQQESGVAIVKLTYRSDVMGVLPKPIP